MNLTEKQIETYIQYPTKLSIEERENVRRQVEGDSETAQYFEWFKEYYSIYKELTKKKIELLEPVISLKPMVDDSESDRTIFVLAAQSEDKKEIAIETLKTFVSEEHKTLVRALHFKSRNEIQIHLLSNEVQKDDILLFHIPDQEYLFISNPGGKVSLSANDKSAEDVREWISLNVHLPICTAALDKKDLNRSYLAGQSVFTEDIIPIEKESKENSVQLTPFPDQSDQKYNYLVLYGEDQSKLFKMRDGAAKVDPELLDSEGVRLYFYN